jgi:hypothetical protein
MKRTLLSLCACVAAFALATRTVAQTKPATTQARVQLPPAPPSEAAPSAPLPPGMVSIFDGQTLNGWVMLPPNAASLGSGDVADLPALLKRLAAKSDPVSTYVSEQLDEPTRAALSSPQAAASREFRGALSKQLGAIVSGPSIYDEARFKGVTLREETQALLKSKPQDREVARLNRVLLEDAFPKEVGASPAVAWRARDGILESLGAGRGVIYTKKSFPNRYRVIFDVRHRGALPGKDHQAGVLVFCTPVNDGEKPVNDALAGIQFQVPKGGSWDYRPGKNNSGKGLFTRPEPRPSFDERQWARVEILADPATGVARMAVAQPPGSKAVEVLNFSDPTAGRAGPFALQMHNAGLFDEFANLAVEENPKGDELITMK